MVDFRIKGQQIAEKYNSNKMDFDESTYHYSSKDKEQQFINAQFVTEEDKKGIDEGKEGCRVGDSGSLRDKGMYKLIMSYMLMCRIAAKFPRAVTRFLMITRLSRGLKYFEPFLGHLIRFWNIDKRDRIYVFHYWDYLTKFFRLKLKSTKAIFNIFW